ncbi:MAG: hypothetical protein V2I24_09340 [Halieaceae bacterium]|jgi:hypothetical protein|nr:hypothetical protein [Halieaceae bacterium]
MPEATGSKTTGLLDAAVQSLADVSFNGARIRAIQDRTPDTFAWAENDTILLARLPGDAVLGADSLVRWEALGASVTMDIGVRPVTGSAFATDPDAIQAGIDVSSAGQARVVNAPTDFDKKLWEYTDLSAEPAIMPEIEVYASLLDANPTDDAVVGWQLQYMID